MVRVLQEYLKLFLIRVLGVLDVLWSEFLEYLTFCGQSFAGVLDVVFDQSFRST